jgi:MFS family permease
MTTTSLVEKKLEANLRKYQLFITLQKRAFLPIIGIYLVSIAKLSLVDIATIASITTGVRLLLEVPTGYFADRVGRKWSTVLGSFIASLSPLAFIVAPHFSGGLAASLLYFGGWAFVSGAHNAFIHDTLSALDREKEYAKFRGRAQSYSLVGNMFIIVAVPATYAFDPRMPFILGFMLLFLAFVLAFSYTEPPATSGEAQQEKVSIRRTLHIISKTDLVILFSVYGIISALFDNAPQYREILFAHLGVPIVYFGTILAVGSLTAALMGRIIHHLAELPHRFFYFIDVIIMTSALVLIGITHNPYMAIFGFLIMVTYDRNRAIVAETHCLSKYKTQGNKATLLSILSFFSAFHGLWIALLVGAGLHRFGISLGFVYVGVGVGILLISLLLLGIVLEKHERARVLQ